METNEIRAKRTKQVKTVSIRLDNSEEFDTRVNEALADGWYLVKRYTLPAYTENRHIMLVAELQRYVYD